MIPFAEIGQSVIVSELQVFTEQAFTGAAYQCQVFRTDSMTTAFVHPGSFEVTIPGCNTMGFSFMRMLCGPSCTLKK